MTNEKQLTEDEGKYLLEVARKTIKNTLFSLDNPVFDFASIPEKLKKKHGTFVTIMLEGCLRGCIGHIIPSEPLIEGIEQNAVNAAFRDPRFPPLRPDEFDKIQIEISILTPPQELLYDNERDLLAKIRPGIDGVILQKGFHEATFLPQVWNQLPDKKEFLAHLCLKAGLNLDSWKREKLRIYTYQVQAFEEKKLH